MAKRSPLFKDLVEVIDDLPALLKLMRRARSLSLRDVAAQSGVSLISLSRIERGLRDYAASSLRKLLIWLDESGGEPRG